MSKETATAAATEAAAGSQAGVVIGRVVSNKMNKGVSVVIERRVRHPIYRKYIRRTSKVLAHDEANACNEGDTVAIVECRPLSKRKAWRVIEIVKTADAT